MPENLVAQDLASGALREVQVKGLREHNTLAMLVIRRRDRVLAPGARWVLSRLMSTRPSKHAR